jgi:hypothetical protein
VACLPGIVAPETAEKDGATPGRPMKSEFAKREKAELALYKAERSYRGF